MSIPQVFWNGDGRDQGTLIFQGEININSAKKVNIYAVKHPEKWEEHRTSAPAWKVEMSARGYGSVLQNTPFYIPNVQPGLCPTPWGTGVRFFSPPQTAFICQNFPGRWKSLDSEQQIASDKVLSIPALKTLFSKIQITESFFCVGFFFFIISANKLFSFKRES